MRDVEGAIDKVLAGLREAEAPKGMEARVLQTLKQRTAAKGPQRTWSWRPVIAGLFVTAGVIFVAAVVQVQKAEHARQLTASSAKTELRKNQANGVPHQLTPHDDDVGYGSFQAVHRDKRGHELLDLSSSAASMKVPIPLGTREAASVQEVSGAEGVPDYDALAMSELLAPSRPAPPLPLTLQERLLAQVAHKGEPEQVATLRPDVRAKQVEISKAEFLMFFEPPPPRLNDSE